MASKLAKKPQLFTCNDCQKVFKTKSTLRYHLYSHKPGNGTFTCNNDGCKRTFKNPKRLSDHKRRYHLNTEDYVCEYCGYHTRIKCNLTVHRRQHTGERPYCCEHCGNGFASSYQLNIHREIHSGERKYCCIICAESFNDAKALYHHRALHAEENKYVCNLCDKSYRQSAGLSQHVRWHRKQQERCTDVIKIVQ
ncbi:oocyte zinc finger protein XlCOF15-like [Calliphora vicina]|uniref:oocyte zinc finger protein XlCOF15-like n=1 Tax=Calliphora vicina TaxID=7373 RepID=UPI00325B38A7